MVQNRRGWYFTSFRLLSAPCRTRTGYEPKRVGIRRLNEHLLGIASPRGRLVADTSTVLSYFRSGYLGAA